MRDEEIGLTFFTEGEPRTPDGLPSVFASVDQASMLARIDEVEEDDLASSFFADSLIEVENAATRVFDVGLRPRSSLAHVAAVPVAPPAAPAHVEPEPVADHAPVVEPEPVADHAPVVEPEPVADHAPVVEPEPVVDPQPEPVLPREESVPEPEPEPEHREPLRRASRLASGRDDAGPTPITRQLITVPGLLSKDADARRAFILGGPGAVAGRD